MTDHSELFSCLTKLRAESNNSQSKQASVHLNSCMFQIPKLGFISVCVSGPSGNKKGVSGPHFIVRDALDMF